MHLPALIQDLAIILGVAAIITFIFRRIKQPVVLGYLVAGIIVGPYTPAVFSVADTKSIDVWAELGVIFLMFALGLEFSFRRLARVGMSAAVTASIQVGTMLLAGLITGHFLRWSSMDSIFLGCMIAISSTTIIIKTLDELGLKTKKFAELVFGILIVEDLVAIIMLVALTNIAKTAQFDGISLLIAGGKMAIVVGAWFVAGIFVVPRFVKSVRRHGNDEILTIVAIGLCLAFVWIADYFEYSAALGAFIIGSIIAESSEAKRIEELVAPLKDIFGAVFFVSVGMLLSPAVIWDNIGVVLLLSAVIIIGKFLCVTLSALLTGESIKNAVQVSLSLTQIGELSFVIASLGLSFGVIDAKLHPIIVSVSLLTTFTTPYLVQWAPKVGNKIEAMLPPKVKTLLDNYLAWLERQLLIKRERSQYSMNFAKWILNSIVVISVFTIAAANLIPVVSLYIENGYTAIGLSWVVAFGLASPSIYAMLWAFREHGPGSRLLSRILTIGLLGLLSVEYFPAPVTLVITVLGCAGMFYFFRGAIEVYYRRMERQFKSGFQIDIKSEPHHGPLNRLAPWDAYLVEIKVPGRSFVVGKTLLQLALRESFGINIVVIVRDGINIIAPKAKEMLYPQDSLWCFGTDAEVERFNEALTVKDEETSFASDLDHYDLFRVPIAEGVKVNGMSIRDSGLGERFECIIVGLEHRGERIRNPKSDMVLETGDVLWVLGEVGNISRFTEAASVEDQMT